MKKYICDNCLKEWESGWTVEESLAEAVANGWGGLQLSEMAQVCDDCYKKMAKRFGWDNAQGKGHA